MEPQPNSASDLVRAELVAQQARGPIRVVIEQPASSMIFRGLKWLAALVLPFMFLLLFIGVIGSMSGAYDTDSDLTEHWDSLSKTASNKVAIISVEGTIMGDESFVKKQIEHVRKNKDIKAIVLRVDSPGGTVTGSDYIYHHLKKLAAERELPMVVSMGSIAASGGYYVAMAVGDKQKDVIFAEPTTWTGSIGVIIPHYDFSGLLEKYHVQDDSIASNPLKMMGSPTRKFPEAIRVEEQAILKGLVDSSFDSFKEIVLSGRPELRDKKEVQDVVFTGRMPAKQAQENLLVDKLGFIEDAIERAIELAKLDKDVVRVIKFKKPVGLSDVLLFGEQGRKQSFDVSALLELTVPRAYYLCSFAPGLAMPAMGKGAAH